MHHPSNYKSSDSGVNKCILIFLCFFVLAACILPIVNLSFSAKYKDDISCVKQNTTNLIETSEPSNTVNLANTIGVITWLNVNGVIALGEIVNVTVFIVSTMLAEENSCCLCACLISFCFHILIGLFRFSWLVVGAIMFWRDCPNVSPTPINSLMWATLILGFIGLLTTGGTGAAGKRK